MKSGHIVFAVNLLQDINIIRPLVYMASNDLGRRILFLVTGAFRKRDKTGLWQQELAEIVSETRAEVVDFNHEFDALRGLRDKSGVLIAASESHLNAHKPVHDLFRVAPARFQKITLQHGFECVGFLQSRDQNLAHGASITFAADIICGWCEAERLTSITPSQRHKLYVTGPTAVLQMPAPSKSKEPLEFGLVCENMHSPRLNVAGDFKTDFLGIFADYCAALQVEGRKVALRPHPGGQYTLKNNVPLQKNVVISNAPIYKTDLTRYAYGISAPSSILIDMVLAGIPTAVWQDHGSIMDLGNYEGLTRISSLQDWLNFSKEAVACPKRFIEVQSQFMQRQRMQCSPDVVYQRYASLLNSTSASAKPDYRPHSSPERVLYIANGYVATLQISFIKPLALMVESGEMIADLILEKDMYKKFKKKLHDEIAREWVRERFILFKPTLVVFCRYSGPHASLMLELANELSIPTIYHIDDDLLNVPKDIGLTKYQYHTDPARLSAVRLLLSGVTLVSCANSRLKARLAELDVKTPLVVGHINCSGQVLSPALSRPVKKIGYMGVGHENDLATILPALIKYMRNNASIEFEFFGTIPVPVEFKEFGDRVKLAPKIEKYEEFLDQFSKFGWDIGICPLMSTSFNDMKSNNKWVEYTSVGAAVVASRSAVYDDCCADGCGIQADTEDEWFAALDMLTNDPEARFKQVRLAQEKLIRTYSIELLRKQVLDLFTQAHYRNVKSELKEAMP